MTTRTHTRGPRSSAALLESAVLACFDGARSLHRAEIAERTGLSRTVVTSLLKELVGRGTLSVAPGSRDRSPGRPAFTYQLSSVVAPVALVRLGPATTSLVLADAAGPRSADSVAALPTSPGTWDRAVLDFLRRARGGGSPGVRQVVIAAPFPVTEDGPPVLPSDGPLARRLTAQFDAVASAHERLSRWLAEPVTLVNDAQLAALGEAVFGAAAGTRASVHLSVRHGIGSGLVFDGRLFSGPGGTAGEIAHVQIDADGPDCLCGGRGCLATQLAGKDADLVLSELYGRALTGREADELVAAGDPVALRFYQDAGRKAARALSGLVTVLTPDAIVIDAQLGPAHVPFTTSLADGLGEHCPPGQIQHLRLVRGRLADAQAYGAVALQLGSAN
ncbi:ROK family protein [Streptomyces sp. NPDC008150]|uniref:ROK family transcriptional regulator n=1 Tax=Streptomyces sp. NPDC008150 TaxID=3364816 RepID=UPI0036E79743